MLLRRKTGVDSLIIAVISAVIINIAQCESLDASVIEYIEMEPEAARELNNQTIDDIITPSDICKVIVGRFASAISNFTLCSVTNARPIHMCQWCIHQYLIVIQTHHDFTATIDEKGNPCQEYFTNLDRIEIVSAAYKYVMNLWVKGKCDYCFLRMKNGTIMPRATEETVKFEMFYQLTKSCFDRNLHSNDTCNDCKQRYNDLNQFYIKIGDEYGENICLDIVDTMNTTREIWSGVFNCVPQRIIEVWLHIGMCVVGVLPVIFYSLTFCLSNKQEARVLHQSRLAEVFAVTSQSGGTDFTDTYGRNSDYPSGPSGPSEPSITTPTNAPFPPN